MTTSEILAWYRLKKASGMNDNEIEKEFDMETVTPKESIDELKKHSIYSLIQMERIQQDVKWGEQNHDNFKWLAILSEEFGEAGKAVCEQMGTKYTQLALRENLEIELIQVSAVCIAWIECLRRNEIK